MTFFWQILKKRRGLLAFGVGLCLFASFYFSFNLSHSENIGPLKTGFVELQNLNFEGFSPLAVFFLLIAATLVSEDLTCIAAGVLASQGRIGIGAAIAACAVGIFIGDILTFLAGRVLGRRALKWKITAYLLSEEAVDKSSRWLERQGLKTVFISRFVFGMRLPLYFGAGVLKTSFWRFTLYFSLAVAVWTPIVVYATYRLGAAAVKMSLFNQNLWLGLLVFVAVFYLSIRFLQRLLTWKGRRILWGKIKRRFIWEFWPLRVFYFPVVIYVLYLALKHRSLTVFTCVNPAIPAGGFVGESKAEILRGLYRSEAAEPFLLKHLFLSKDFSGDEKSKMASDFMTENDLTFPVVLKPDVGERGLKVQIIGTKNELYAALKADENLILQEYAGGDEASVFYFRHPENEKGEIFSITEKRFPRVTGDGVSTLEELILRDSRAVCLAEKYLERNSERLDTIPEKGETVPIVDIGTHSRGAVFLDGGWLRTAELETKIDEICRGCEGFYFGRFDIRVESFESFKRAQNFKIVELNGVTSEATNIYDPRYSLVDAYKILFRQWKNAFEIGAANKKRGARSTKIIDLTKLILGGQIPNPKSQIPN